MPLLPPATRNVSFSISLRISPKSWYLLSVCKNSPYSCGTASPTPPGRVNCGFAVADEEEAGGGGGGELREGGVWTSWRTSGRRVTMPWPRGRKSRPTILRASDRVQQVRGGGGRKGGRLTSRGPRIFRHSGIRCVGSIGQPMGLLVFARRAALHDDDLGEVDRLASNGRERVLELVERPDQVDSAVSLGRHPVCSSWVARVECKRPGRNELATSAGWAREKGERGDLGGESTLVCNPLRVLSNWCSKSTGANGELRLPSGVVIFSSPSLRQSRLHAYADSERTLLHSRENTSEQESLAVSTERMDELIPLRTESAVAARLRQSVSEIWNAGGRE